MNNQTTHRSTVWAAALLAVAAAIYIIRTLYDPLIGPILGVLLPFSIAIGIALLLAPIIDRMEARGISRGMAVALVTFAFLGVLVIIGVFLVPVAVAQAIELGKSLPSYYDGAQKAVGKYMESHQALLQRFHLPTTVGSAANKVSNSISAAGSDYLKRAGGLLAGTASVVVWMVLIPIVTIFLLTDINNFKRRVMLFVPSRHRERSAAVMGSVGRVFGSYIRGLLIIAFLYAIACGIVIALWGVPYAIVLGVVAGILSLVPYVGTISTLILVAIIAVVHETTSHGGNPLNALWVVISLLLMNQVFDNLVGPKILGKAVGVHPALAILALLIGGDLFGLPGMILAVPIAASIQIVILEFMPQLREAETEEQPKEPFLKKILARIRSKRQSGRRTDSGNRNKK